MKGHFRGGTCARPGGRKRTSYLRQANVRTQRTRRTNAFLVEMGDKTAMGLLAKLLWTLVRLNNASQTSAMGRLNVRPMLLTCRHNCWLRTGCEERVLDGRRPDGAQRWAVDETESDGVTSAWSKTFDELLVQCRVGRVHRQTNASPVQPTTNLYQTHTLWTLAAVLGGLFWHDLPHRARAADCTSKHSNRPQQTSLQVRAARPPTGNA